MSALLKRRRKDPRTAALLRLTGMEMKMKQYELGEGFVTHVERRAGWSTRGPRLVFGRGPPNAEQRSTIRNHG